MTMSPEERSSSIERYGGGYDAVMEALARVADDEMDIRPSPDGWTAREVVHHLADAELRSTIRLRQLVAEDDPVIQGYDEPVYARRLHYDRPIEVSLDAFRVARAANADLLAVLSEEDWASSGTHEESGRYSVEDWLRIYTSHPYDHADQIRRVPGR